MGEMIDFASNGGTADGYLATPSSGSGPGVVVIQEWWGLVPHIKEVCDRFAAAGFTALAPDLYHGEATREPDEAGKMMMGMRLDQAIKDMSGTVDALGERTGGKVAVVGFCMGGGLALILAATRGDKVAACSSFYGALPWEDAEPDWSGVSGSIALHVGDKDDWAMGFANDLAPKLEGLGKEHMSFHYAGTDHAFFNDHRPEVFDRAAAELAWDRTIEQFRSALVD
ncbi:MAG TPA: dienelactone hydrolase family protein [Acidimicrobiales bacterium]|nr:dienelactone hydrolase family protein [Acidimicrobiales bacterium]